jgi:ribosome-binding factor A
METIRQKQVSELIRRHFSMILSQEGPLFYGREPLVTLSSVKMTPDLLVAKMYVSIWNTEEKEVVLVALEDNAPKLRQALSSKVGKQMRRLPEIQFFLDETIDEMYRVEELLNRIDQKDTI